MFSLMTETGGGGTPKYLIPEHNREGHPLDEAELASQNSLTAYLTVAGKAIASGSRYASWAAYIELDRLEAAVEDAPYLLQQNLPPYHMDTTCVDYTMADDMIHPTRLEALGFIKSDEPSKCPWTEGVWHHRYFLIDLHILKDTMFKPWKDAMLVSMARSGQWGAFQFNKEARDTLWAAQINYTNELIRTCNI